MSMRNAQLPREPAGRVVIENFGVAAPLDGGFELAAGFFLAEMFVEEVAEKFLGECAIGFSFERLLHLAEQGNVGESGLAENRFAGLNVRLSKRLAFRSDDGVALFDAKEAKQNGSVDGGEECINFETQFIGEAMQINAAALVG